MQDWKDLTSIPLMTPTRDTEHVCARAEGEYLRRHAWIYVGERGRSADTESVIQRTAAQSITCDSCGLGRRVRWLLPPGASPVPSPVGSGLATARASYLRNFSFV